MEREHIDHLVIEAIYNYPNNSDGERRLLEEWIAVRPANRQIFEKLVSTEYVQELVKEVEGIRLHGASRWEKLQVLLQGAESKTVGRGKVSWFGKRYILAAAACLMLVVGFYIFRTERAVQPSGEESTGVAKVKDVAPGQFKAKLTLADGSVILLDSATKRELAVQGGTKVVNEEGRLSYEAGKGNGELVYNTLTTGKGEMYLMQLSEGTKVWLNSQSSLRFPVSFTGDMRRVSITGEAYFEVAPSKSLAGKVRGGKRPFVVSLIGAEVEVLGTHFNINSYQDEPSVKATLVEGKVRVRNTESGAELTLEPGQQAQIGKDGQGLALNDKVDTEAEAAWHLGFFQFGGADIKAVMRQLERWYDIKVEYHGDMGKHAFRGKIYRDMTLAQVLSILEKQNARFSLEGRRLIVSPR